MNKLKTAAAALVFLLCTAVLPMQVQAAPEGMRFSIETKELAAEEIPDDRVISLKVSSEALPPFTKLRVLLQKDAPLEYGIMCGTLCPELSGSCGMGFSFSPGVDADFTACNISVRADDPLDYNGDLFELFLVLPEHVQPGDFYGVRILNTFTDGFEYDTMVRDEAVRYGKDCFAELGSGGIRIKQPGVQTPPEPVQQEQPQQTPPAEPANGNAEPSQADDPPEETTAPAESAAETTATTAAAATAAAETTLTTESGTAPPQTETETVTAAGTETAPPQTEPEEQKPKDKNRAFPVILIGTAAACAGTGETVRRRRKGRNKQE